MATGAAVLRVRGLLGGRDLSALLRLLATAPPVATSRAFALIGTLFYVSGGVSVAFVTATHPEMHHRTPLYVIGVGAVLLGLVVGRGAAHIPQPARIAMNFGGTTLVLAVVLLAGRGTSGEALFWLFCFVPVDSFIFFAWRWALPMLAWGVVATGVVTFKAKILPPTEWGVVLVVATSTAVVIGWLVRFGSEALEDPVTGMLNRRGFDDGLRSRCSDGTQAGHRFSLAAVRVDGGESGARRHHREQIVVRLATQLRSRAPRSARWARLSDADFAVFWDASEGFDTYLEDVLDTARPTGTLSIGICDFRRGFDPARMLNEAVAGRIFSGRAGGDRVTRSGLVAGRVEELRRAIADGAIRPHYQPIVDLASGEIIGAEALARWCDPDGGVTGPAAFIPLAEQSGDMIALGASILRRACADAAGWPGIRGRSMKVSVNVSGEQLHDDTFVDVVRRCLRESGLPPGSLTLEVTESTVGGDDPQAREILAELRLEGVSIAMDDFGTGYSNLARLAGLPIDVLKIDQSFVRPLEGSSRSVAIVDALVGLARRLGLTTVAEGVEEPRQRDLLNLVRADRGQGFLFGRAVPNDEFVAAVLLPGRAPAR